MIKKKLFSALMAVTMVASLTACGKTDSSTATVVDDTSNKAVEAADYQAMLTSNAAIYEKYMTLGDYKGLSVTVDPKTEVTDDNVDSQISSMLTNTSTTESVTDGVTQSGDKITLDYTGLLDGVAFSGGTATDASYTVGSGSFIDDLDKGLVGLALNTDYSIPCTFPTDYSSSDLAGKAVVFNVKVTAISRTVVPTLTDEWAAANASTYGYTASNVAELKAAIRTALETSNLQAYNSNIYAACITAIQDKTTFSSMPSAESASLLTTYKSNIESQYNTYASIYASSYGINSFDDYLTQAYGSTDDFNTEAQTQVETYLKEKMIITAIAAKEGIEVTADDITSLGDEYATYYNYDNYQAIIDQYGTEMNAELGYESLYNKLTDYFVANATVSNS